MGTLCQKNMNKLEIMAHFFISDMSNFQVYLTKMKRVINF